MARRVLLPSTDSTDRTLEYIDTVLEKGGYDTWGASGVQAELLEQSSGRKPSPGASRGFRPLTQGGAGGQAEAQLGRSPARACLRPCASASASLPGLLPSRSPGGRGASGPVTLSRDWPGNRGASETPVSQAAPGSVRLAQLRSSQRARAEKEQELDQAFSAPPQWWQSVQTQQRSAQLALWAQQAFSKEALENLALSLPPLADEAARHGSELPGQCHAELQRQLREYADVTGRLRRFALLCTQPAVGRLSTQEERQLILLRLLGALRVAMAGAVEGVQACQADQQRYLRSAAVNGLVADRKAQVKEEQREILRESASCHEETLVALVRQVAWLPLPFVLDPLLLRWFDEHYEIWGCAATISTDAGYLRRWHTPADLERMRKADHFLL